MTLWRLPDPRQFPAGVELIGLTARFDPDLALVGYRRGIFAMDVAGGVMGWFSPDPRGVLPLTGLHVGRSLHRARRRFTVTVDRAFAAVVDGCADPARSGAWITPAYRSVYLELHRRGVAHSVEVWSGPRLAGGVFGVEQGGLYCGESMFHRDTDASKVALVELVERLSAGEDSERRLFDVQWWTPHLATLGVVEIPRARYLDRLPGALALPPALSG